MSLKNSLDTPPPTASGGPSASAENAATPPSLPLSMPAPADAVAVAVGEDVARGGAGLRSRALVSSPHIPSDSHSSSGIRSDTTPPSPKRGASLPFPSTRILWILTFLLAVVFFSAFLIAGILISNTISTNAEDKLIAQFRALCEVQTTEVHAFATGQAATVRLLAKGIQHLPTPASRTAMFDLLAGAAGLFTANGSIADVDTSPATFQQYFAAPDIRGQVQEVMEQYDPDGTEGLTLRDISIDEQRRVRPVPFNDSRWQEAFVSTHTSRIPADADVDAVSAARSGLFFNQYSEPVTADFIEWAIESNAVVSLPPRVTIRGVKSIVVGAAVWTTDYNASVPSAAKRDHLRGTVGVLVWNTTVFDATDQGEKLAWRLVDANAEITLIDTPGRHPQTSVTDPDIVAALHHVDEFEELGRRYTLEYDATEALVEQFADDADTILLVVFILIGCFSVAATILTAYYLKRSNASHLSAIRNEYLLRIERAAKAAETNAHQRVLGYVHHEIRNPLNAIVGSVELLRSSCTKSRTTLDELLQVTEEHKAEPHEERQTDSRIVWLPKGGGEGARPVRASDVVLSHKDDMMKRMTDVDVIAQATEQMELHLHDMLDLQRLRRGELQLNPKAVDLQEVLQGVVAGYKPQSRVPIELTTDGSVFGNPMLIVLDETRFRQVISCGLSNALKYSSRSGAIDVHSHVLTGRAGRKELRRAIQAQAARSRHSEAIREWQPLRDQEREAAVQRGMSNASDSDAEDLPQSGVLVVSIKDNGKGLGGIPVERVFRPFVALRAFAEVDEQSSGLGLAIAALVAAVMQGAVDLVDSGSGCVFRFVVPVELRPTALHTTEEAVPPALEAPPLLTQSEGAAASSTVHALVVDDDRTNVRLVSRMLRMLGVSSSGIYAGDIAEEVEAALQGTQQLLPSSEDSAQDAAAEGKEEEEEGRQAPQPFTVVFLDIRLGPTTSGVEIVRQVLPRLRVPRLPILAMTANTRGVDLTEYKAAGFSGVVPKPVSRRKLQAILTHLQSKEGFPAWVEC